MDKLDFINDVYFGKLYPSSTAKARERIHWICQRVKMTDVLDVGCSQGITDILIAREGFHVYGVDISEETIASANTYRDAESPEVQARLKFETADFYQQDFGDQKFDTIIMSEVLEHLVQPERFIEKSQSLLKDDGVFVITVPFGIMDHPDHKGTFYLLNIMELLEPFFDIVEACIIHEWLAFTAVKSNFKKNLPAQVDRTYVRDLEKNMQIRERNLLDTIEKLKNNLDLKKFEAETKDLKNKIWKRDTSIFALTETVDTLRADLSQANMAILKLKAEAILSDVEYMKDINHSRNVFEKTIRIYKTAGLKRVIYKILKKLKLRK